MILKNQSELINHLNGRNDVLVCITGPTGCGKSTIVGNLSYRNNFLPIQPGKAIRNNPELLKKVLDSDNPSAPRVTEDWVRNHVTDHVRNNPYHSYSIDGMPRSVEQVMFCFDLAYDFNLTIVYVYVEVPYQVRVDRLKLRGQSGDLELNNRRLENDKIIFPAIVERMKQIVYGGKVGEYIEINETGE